MKTLNSQLGSEAVAVAAFKDEGAFLFSADRAAEALARRVLEAHPSVKVFHLTRDQMAQLSADFTRLVEIGKDYHIGVADLAA